ncbi:lipopolysaccharide biosynthesis protein [Pseudonocardia sp.]|uniref:lipopolysaccharide biosynthesis protein n=1 Tax=Pseudonocardia sp. TaxID=60912 RepID=UPI003D1205CE
MLRIPQRLHNLQMSPMARGVARIMTGSVAGQGLVILCYPVLTRLYDPAEFGLLTVFSSVVGMISVVSSVSLFQAIPVPPDDQDAADLAWTALAIVTFTTVVTAGVGLVAGEQIGSLLGVPRLADYWWLVALTVFVMGAYLVLSEWMVRERSYGALARRNLLMGVGQATTQVGLGVAGVTPLGLLLGLGVGRACALGGLLSSGGLLRRARPGPRTMRAALVRFRRFPLLATPAAFVTSAGLEVPLLVVSAFYGDARAGLLGLTVRVFSGPAQVIGEAIDQVFSGESSARIRNPDGTVAAMTRTTVRRLLLIGLAPAVLLATSGPWLFSVVFGPDWSEAGFYAQLLALPYLLQFAVNPVSGLLLYLQRQGQSLGWSCMRLVFTGGGPALCAVLGAPVWVAVAALAASHVLSYLLLYVLCVRAARAADAEYRRKGSPA